MKKKSKFLKVTIKGKNERDIIRWNIKFNKRNK